MLPKTSAEELRGVGRKVHALRNALAHPGTDAEDISFSETVELVKQTRKLIARVDAQSKLDLRQLGRLGRGN